MLSKPSSLTKKITQVLVSVFVGLNLFSTLTSLVNQKPYSYSDYTQSILSHIPDNKTVFLSVTPDPYFGFQQAGRSNQLIEFPVLSTSLESYQQALDQSDYIIYDQSYNQVLFGNFLETYIASHEQEKVLITAGGYSAYIIKTR